MELLTLDATVLLIHLVNPCLKTLAVSKDSVQNINKPPRQKQQQGISEETMNHINSMHCFFLIYKTIHYIDLLDGRSTFATQVGRAPFQGKRAGLINDRTCFTSSVKLYSQELEEMIQWVSGCLKRRRENLCALTLSFTQKKLSIYLDSTDSNALLLSTLSVA